MPQNRFRKLLISLDGSQNSIRGLNEAISLARQCKSIIIAIHVIPLLPPNFVGMHDIYTKYLQKKANDILTKAQTAAGQHRVELQMKILYGNDTVKIINRFAKNAKTDLIILGSRGKGNPTGSFLGSVSNGIIYLSKILVLIVK